MLGSSVSPRKCTLTQRAHADTSSCITLIMSTAPTALELPSPLHVLFYINSQCKEACLFGADQCIPSSTPRCLQFLYKLHHISQGQQGLFPIILTSHCSFLRVCLRSLKATPHTNGMMRQITIRVFAMASLAPSCGARQW